MARSNRIAKMYASTPLSAGTSELKPFPSEQPEVHAKKPTIDMVCAAIEAVGDPRKGASYQAIKKYVLGQHEESESVRVAALIRRALIKGIDKGILERPRSSKNVVGAQGFFIMVKKKPKITKKSKDSQKEPKKTKMPTDEQVSDIETIAKKPIKLKKLNSLDTVVMDLEKVKQKKTVKQKNKPNAELPKATVKKVKNNETAKKPRSVKNAAEKKEDVSDSEIVVNEASPKSLKSYSSNEEVEVAGMNKTTALKKAPKNKPRSKKNAADKKEDVSDSEIVVNEASPKSLKSYSSNEEVEVAGMNKTTALKKAPKNKPRSKKNAAEKKEDVSDSEIVVNEASPKSLKSYSSNEEVEVAGMNKTTALKKAPKSKPRSKKNAAVKKEDVSDSEIVVNEASPKSLKSYSFNEEVEVAGMNKTIALKKAPKNKPRSQKNAAEKRKDVSNSKIVGKESSHNFLKSYSSNEDIEVSGMNKTTALKKAPKNKPRSKKNAAEKKEDVSDSEMVVNEASPKSLKSYSSNEEVEGAGMNKTTALKKAPKNKPRSQKNVAEKRQDVSDSEMVVKKTNRKSLKSYSSDTEMEVARMNKTAMLKKAPKKTGTKNTTSKQKAVEPFQSPKISKVKEQKKLYSSEEHIKKEKIEHKELRK